MKVKIVGVLLAAAALSFTTAGSAAAHSAEPAAPPQVNGVRLQAAMLPPSSFGTDVSFVQALNSGSKLTSTHIKDHVSSMSCANFEDTTRISVWGDTAGAYLNYQNPHWQSQYPNAILFGDEEVLQFATVASATTFYGQVRAKFAACGSFSEPFDRIFTATVQSVKVVKTTVKGDTAFEVTQGVTLAGFKTTPFYFVDLYVVAGTDVYSFYDSAGTNDEPSPTLMTKFIHQVQALYP